MDSLIDDSKDLTKTLLSRAFEDHLAIGPQRVIAQYKIELLLSSNKGLISLSKFGSTCSKAL